jgi:hypothetical protein
VVSAAVNPPEATSASAVVDDGGGEDPVIAPDPPSGRQQLTTVDRYFRVWAQYAQARGSAPNPEQLSAYLAERGLTGRNGAGVSPSTLRRYLPEFRSYAAWQQWLEDEGTEPSGDQLTRMLASRGFTGEAYTPAKLSKILGDFPRRRSALAGDWVDSSA